MDIKIREAALADLPVIADFNVQLAWESEALELELARVEAGVASLLRDPAKGRYYLAELSGEVVGQLMTTYEWSDWRNGNMWWIQSVYVKPRFRRAGVFRALFNHLQDLAHTCKDVCSLRLYVYADNTRASESYERLGMNRTRYEVFELDVPREDPTINNSSEACATVMRTNELTGGAWAGQMPRCFLNIHPRIAYSVRSLLLIAVSLAAVWGRGETGASARDSARSRVAAEYPSLFELYKHLHAHPELSFQEVQSAARMAEELRQAGCEVTTGVGKRGVVGVLRNGDGPTLLLRADMDALPVKEQTGLSYASTVTAKDAQGNEVPVMHACGHDMHMTWLVGAARVLAQMKDQWRGTLLFIGQPAEEASGGASGMLADGLFQRFPRPDACLALHDDAEHVAGTVGYAPGHASANINSVDILVHGVGGHGAHPHKAKDPVVLAAQIVLALQTIVSREVRPGEPVVVTVGTIHGGTRRNIIPDQVRLQLTVRSHTDDARRQTLEAIKRIARGQALAAGMPEDCLPEVKVDDDFTPALYNDPKLTERLIGALSGWLSETNLSRKQPSMGGEDFSEFGRTEPRIPICMLDVGGVSLEAIQQGKQSGKPLPSLHSPFWAPVPEPTIKSGVTVFVACVLELSGKGKP